jgi:Na+-driven multidrug efflux pump
LHLALAVALTFGYEGTLLQWPALHLKGTALGAGIAHITGSAILLYLWMSNRLLIRFNRPRLQRDVFARLWSIASPAVVEQMVMQMSLLLFLGLIARYGDAPFAAYGIGLSILSVTMVVGLGFSISGAALVGQAIGAGDAAAARSAAFKALKLAALTMTVLGGIVLIFAEPLANFMIDDAETVRLTTVFLWVLACTQPFMAVDFALGGALRGAGDTRFALLATLCTFVGLRVGLAGLLTWLNSPVEYIFATLVIDYGVKAALLSWRYRSDHWLRIIKS